MRAHQRHWKVGRCAYDIGFWRNAGPAAEGMSEVRGVAVAQSLGYCVHREVGGREVTQRQLVAYIVYAVQETCPTLGKATAKGAWRVSQLSREVREFGKPIARACTGDQEAAHRGAKVCMLEFLDRLSRRLLVPPVLRKVLERKEFLRLPWHWVDSALLPHRDLLLRPRNVTKVKQIPQEPIELRDIQHP